MSVLGLVILGSLKLTPFVVMYQSEWHVFARDGAYIQSIKDFANEHPNGVAVGPDLKAVAFTTPQGLFYSKEGKMPAKRIGPESGYFTDPAFDEEGKYLYFTHAGGANAGPIGAHGSGANAQLWKVNLSSGVFEQLTTSHGCKRHPQPRPSGGIYYIHSTCDGASGIEYLGKETRTLVPAAQENLEIRASPDDKMLAWFRQLFNGAELVVTTNKAPFAPKVLVQLSGQVSQLGIAWSSSGDSIFYQANGHLWCVAKGGSAPKAVFDLVERRAEK